MMMMIMMMMIMMIMIMMIARNFYEIFMQQTVTVVSVITKMIIMIKTINANCIINDISVISDKP